MKFCLGHLLYPEISVLDYPVKRWGMRQKLRPALSQWRRKPTCLGWKLPLRSQLGMGMI